ncbi:MAG: hypothetical protein KDK39_09980 [Leptospiraceae bacterium]|nr:hypothetical protein [Leptospiraceae bacterium]
MNVIKVTADEKTAKAWVVSKMIDRIEGTYADFIADVKGFDKIPWFFRQHLYSPSNKEARDAALDSLYEKLKSVTGPEMTENIHKLIRLNKLTDELDLLTARHLLQEKWPRGLPPENDLKIEELNIAIVQAGRLTEREQQIDLICETLNFFFNLSKLPLIRLVMAPIKVAASMVGASELISTMEAGYELSRGIRDMKVFATAFAEREKGLLHQMAAKHS